jgi:hypothetical protein
VANEGERGAARGGAGGGGDPRANALLVAGIVLFAASWFVPAVQHQHLLTGLGGLTRALGSSPEAAAAGLDGPEWLPGWSACRFAWQLLADPQPLGGGDAWKQRLAGSSCLTNPVMLAAIAAVLLRVRSALLGALLLACAGVDASWVYLGDGDVLGQLGAGYWFWLGSFVLVGLGLMLAPRRP